MPAAKKVCWTLALILSSLLLRHNALAQTDTLKLTSDELFSLAREKAFAGQREEARGLCKTILVRSPSYSDARILLGRAFAWDGRWEEARAEFLRVLQEKPAYKDALLALLDAEIWDEKYERALAPAMKTSS
jgi:tetratricopeptide (TPR) repeat protein